MPLVDQLGVGLVAVVGVAAVGTLIAVFALRRLPAWRGSRRTVRLVGVGHAGSRTLAALTRGRDRLVDSVAVDTDAAALRHARARQRIHVGPALGGQGTGGDPAGADAAARDATDEIERALAGSALVIVTGGLGGGTASGAIPIVADIARKGGALTVAVVSKPFAFEGGRRRDVAESALLELSSHVDAVAVLPNERVREMVADDATIDAALGAMDDRFRSTIDAVASLVNQGGRLGLDFSSARSALRDAGAGFVGVGRATGDERAIEAARQAMAAALLNADVARARSIVVNIAASRTLRLVELDQAIAEVRSAAGQSVDVVVGLTIDRRLGKALQITLIVAGQPSLASRAESATPWLPVWRRDRNAPLPAVGHADEQPVKRSRRGRRPLAGGHTRPADALADLGTGSAAPGLTGETSA